MELDPFLNRYLEKIEKALKPMPASDRIDIVKEIKSEMLELQENNVSPQQITARLGSPKDLAKAYLGEMIAKSSGFSWRRLALVIAFYSLAGISGMFILPITSIGAVSFMICGALCPVAGIVKFVAHLMGHEIEQINISIGAYSASAVAALPLSILLGALSFAVGWLLWKLTILIIKTLSQIKQQAS